MRLLVATEGFYVATELARPGVFCNGGEALCRDRIFYIATECEKMERFCVAKEQFYVAIELVIVGRISVAIEDFYVATELATKKSSAAGQG